jgi:hypothetical protein
MVKAFGSRLDSSLSRLSLPPGVAQEIRAEEIKLAGLPVPTGLSSDTETAIRESIGAAFVFGFRMIMLICAGLSLGSAGVAWRMIPDG